MSSMEALLDQARALGAAIAAQPKIKSFLTARDAVMKDREAQQLMNDFQRHSDRLAQLEMDQQPISVDDKRKLGELQAAMASQPSLKELMRTQADYVFLMNQVQTAMDEPLAPAAS